MRYEARAHELMPCLAGPQGYAGTDVPTTSIYTRPSDISTTQASRSYNAPWNPLTA